MFLPSCFFCFGLCFILVVSLKCLVVFGCLFIRKWGNEKADENVGEFGLSLLTGWADFMGDLSCQ